MRRITGIEYRGWRVPSADIRDPLYQAYLGSHWEPSVAEKYAASPSLFAKRIRGKGALAVAAPSGSEIKEYRTHGLARIDFLIGDLPDLHVVVDVHDLSGPKYAWLRRAPNALRVTISSGKQNSPRKALELKPGIEGLVVVVTGNRNPNVRPIRYNSELEPLYLPVAPEAA